MSEFTFRYADGRMGTNPVPDCMSRWSIPKLPKGVFRTDTPFEYERHVFFKTDGDEFWERGYSPEEDLKHKDALITTLARFAVQMFRVRDMRMIDADMLEQLERALERLDIDRIGGLRIG